jgi:hypothetical protein
MIGREVRKDFGHHGKFSGAVTGLKFVAGFDTPFYKVKYEDGDEEDIMMQELESILDDYDLILGPRNS